MAQSGELTLGTGMEFGTVSGSVVWLYVFLPSENPAGDERDVGPGGRAAPCPTPILSWPQGEAPAEV